jgi:hypothetical protein
MRNVVLFAIVLVLNSQSSYSVEPPVQSDRVFKLAISMGDNHQATISCPSGTPFKLVHLVASSLPEYGYADIKLDITPDGKITNPTDTWLLLEVGNQQGRICASSTLHFSCIAEIAEKIESRFDAKITLVSRGTLMTEDNQWIARKESDNKPLDTTPSISRLDLR